MFGCPDDGLPCSIPFSHFVALHAHNNLPRNTSFPTTTTNNPTQLLLFFSTIPTPTLASAPIPSLSVTLRGKQYDITEVTTVADVQTQLAEKSGVAQPQQGRIIFGGQSLQPDTVLSEAGVPADGTAKLNVVPGATTKKKKKKVATPPKATSNHDDESSPGSSSGSANPMADYLKKSGMDTDQLSKMMESMGGPNGDSMEDNMKNLVESMVRIPQHTHVTESLGSYDDDTYCCIAIALAASIEHPP